MTNRLTTLTCLLVTLVGCQRTADDYEGRPSSEYLEDLRRDACDAACSTFDSCDPDRFTDTTCLDVCLHHMPLIYEENQCGSREMQWMLCLGDLTCEEFVNWETAVNLPNYYFEYPCVAEYGHSVYCSTKEPFDMEEDNTQYP